MKNISGQKTTLTTVYIGILEYNWKNYKNSELFPLSGYSKNLDTFVSSVWTRFSTVSANR